MNNLFGGGKTPQSKSTKRIGYIDAIRGFTILLVVMSHVSGFGLGFNGSNTFSYRIIVESFFIPLFFFISGFVLYKTDRIWTVINTWKFLVGKVSFLLVAPLIFMLALSQVKGNTFIEILFSNMKGGYWFTFSLFEYYVIYAVSRQLGFYMKFKNLVEDVFFANNRIYHLFMYNLDINGKTSYDGWHRWSILCAQFALLHFPSIRNSCKKAYY